MPKKILILFSYAGINKLNKNILSDIQSGDKLFVKAVMLEGVPKLFSHLTSDVGFLGEKVVSDIEDSVVKIYQDNAKEYLKKLKDTAKKNSFTVDTELVNRHELSNLKTEIHKLNPAKIFINFSINEFVSNQVEEKEIKKYLEKIDIEKKIFHDGELGD